MDLISILAELDSYSDEITPLELGFGVLCLLTIIGIMFLVGYLLDKYW